MPKRRRRLKTPPLLYDKTQRLLGRIEARVQGTFLTYWMSTGGSVCDNDVMAMQQVFREIGPQQH